MPSLKCWKMCRSNCGGYGADESLWAEASSNNKQDLSANNLKSGNDAVAATEPLIDDLTKVMAYPHFKRPLETYRFWMDCASLNM